MAGAQTEITANQIEGQRFGYMALSLLEYDTDAEPEIAAGSKVEIGGALFEFASDESITGWGAIGTDEDVYIKLVVAGTAVTAEFTTTAPTWSTSKQGWYGTGGAALDRYVAKLYKDGAGDYTLKRILCDRQTSVARATGELVAGSEAVIEESGTIILKYKVIEIGDWNMDSTATVLVTMGLTKDAIRSIAVMIRPDDPTGVGHHAVPRSNLALDGSSGTEIDVDMQIVTSGELRLMRRTGGFFDQANFDSTSYNRGWVTVWYEA